MIRRRTHCAVSPWPNLAILPERAWSAVGCQCLRAASSRRSRTVASLPKPRSPLSAAISAGPKPLDNARSAGSRTCSALSLASATPCATPARHAGAGRVDGRTQHTCTRALRRWGAPVEPGACFGARDKLAAQISFAADKVCRRSARHSEAMGWRRPCQDSRQPCYSRPRCPAVKL
jgi:hypothetical protein